MEHEYIDIGIRIEDLNIPLSYRAKNGLKVWKIDTIKKLCQHSQRDLMKLRNFGKNSLRDIEDFLQAYGLRLDMDEEELDTYVKEYIAQRVGNVKMPDITNERRRWELASQMLIHTKYDTQEILDIVSEFMEKYKKSLGL